MKTKYVFTSMVIRNGLFTYGSQMAYEIPEEKDILEFADQKVKNYYADKPFQKQEEYNWWYFYGGKISVMLETAEEITKQEFDVLNKFQYK